MDINDCLMNACSAVLWEEALTLQILHLRPFLGFSKH